VMYVGGMVVCVLVEGGLVGDGQVECELVERLWVETVCEMIVCRWVGCGQVVGWGAVCVSVD